MTCNLEAPAMKGKLVLTSLLNGLPTAFTFSNLPYRGELHKPPFSDNLRFRSPKPLPEKFLALGVFGEFQDVLLSQLR